MNAVVRNVDACYTAFDVQPGDKLYLPANQRMKKTIFGIGIGPVVMAAISDVECPCADKDRHVRKACQGPVA